MFQMFLEILAPTEPFVSICIKDFFGNILNQNQRVGPFPGRYSPKGRTAESSTYILSAKITMSSHDIVSFFLMTKYPYQWFPIKNPSR